MHFFPASCLIYLIDSHLFIIHYKLCYFYEGNAILSYLFSCSFLSEDSFLLNTYISSQRDPFGTVSSLSDVDRSRAQNQSVPSLAQFLEVAAQSSKLVLFDLRKPPSSHPYRDSYINSTLQVVQDHINSSLVTMAKSFVVE